MWDQILPSIKYSRLHKDPQQVKLRKRSLGGKEKFVCRWSRSRHSAAQSVIIKFKGKELEKQLTMKYNESGTKRLKI